MPFRIYYLDRCNRVADAVDIEARSLDDARREARNQNPGHPGLEIWTIDDATHWVQLVEAFPAPSPA